MAGQATVLAVSVALIVLSACVSHASRPASLQLLKLKSGSKYPKCLDGSPPAYFLRDGYGSGSDKWLVYLQGGAWCTSKAACAERATTPLGSSKFWPEPSEPTFARDMRDLNSAFTGLLSSSEVQNPDYFNWNVAMVLYCDGGGYAGTAGVVKVNATTNVHLDGHRILKGVMADLSKRGMKSADTVLLTGCSAGAQAVSTSCDEVASMVPNATVKCLMDAGFFLDGWDENGSPAFRTIAQQLVALHKPQYDTDCAKANTKGALWKCFFPQNNLEFVSTPVFIVNSINDYTAMDILNSANKASNASSTNVLVCLDQLRPSGGNAGYVPKGVTKPKKGKKSNSTCSVAAQDALKRYAARLQNRIKSLARRRPMTGTFLLGSIAHCVTIYPTWLSVQRKGYYMHKLVTDWLLLGEKVQLTEKRDSSSKYLRA